MDLRSVIASFWTMVLASKSENNKAVERIDCLFFFYSQIQG